MSLWSNMTRCAARRLDWIAEHWLPQDRRPSHQRTGRRGEEDAYFYLRDIGYVMVARNYRSPRRRGEVDLIGWEGDVLCFVEVKTRSSADGIPAQVAVDRDKQRELAGMAREYRHHLPTNVQWRFDVVSVYYDGQAGRPRIELFKNAFSVS